MPADLKEKLARAEEELSSKRDERKKLAEARDEAKAKFAEVDGYDRESDEYKAAVEATEAVSEIDREISALSETRVDLLKMVGSTDPKSVTRTDHSQPTDEKWSSAGLLAEQATFLERAAKTSGRFGQIDLGAIASREAMAAEIGSGDVAGLIQPDRRGLVQPIYRPLRLLDVLPSGTTNSNLVEYVQVTELPEDAAETSEGRLKPEESLGLEDADAPIRTIAGWLKVRKQTLADAAGLQSLIDTSLRYDVRRRLEAQVIAGDGSGENIQGILETPNVLEPSVSGSDADRVHQGITAVRLANLEPSVVILNPLDWERTRLSRDDSGASPGTGGYLFGPPSQAGASTYWGLQTVLSVVCPEGTAIVCDPNGALVLIREGVNVLVSDSDGDDFRRNRVTVLAEMRAGVMVPRPDAFAIVDLNGS